MNYLISIFICIRLLPSEYIIHIIHIAQLLWAIAELWAEIIWAIFVNLHIFYFILFLARAIELLLINNWQPLTRESGLWNSSSVLFIAYSVDITAECFLVKRLNTGFICYDSTSSTAYHETFASFFVTFASFLIWIAVHVGLAQRELLNCWALDQFSVQIC